VKYPAVLASAHRDCRALPTQRASYLVGTGEPLYTWLWVFLLLLVPHSTARADAPEPTRVIILDRELRGLGERLRRELDSSGFSTRIVPVSADEGRAAQLATLAERENAQLALSLSLTSPQPELLIYDAARARLIQHALDTDGDPDAATLAIRIAELLRATLLEVTLPPTPAADPSERSSAPSSETEHLSETAPAPTAQVALAASQPSQLPAAQKVRGPRSTADIGLGIAVLRSVGGLGPSAALAISVGVLLVRRLRLGVFTFVPLHAIKHEAAEGSSKTRITPLGLDLGGEFFRNSSVRVSLAGGLAVAILTSDGLGTPPSFENYSARRTSVGAYLRGGLGYHFSRALALRGELTMGAQTSRFAIEYAERPVGSWGLPWFGMQIGLDARFP
jgi:hypothetical protein